MDEKLYKYIKIRCGNIRPDQCLLPSFFSKKECLDEYESTNGHDLTLCYKMISLYTSNLHPLIPELIAMWKIDNTFYLKTTASTFNVTSSLDKITTTGRKTLLISLLIELGTAINIMHSMGIAHGYINESSLVINDCKAYQVLLTNFNVIKMLDFQQAKSADTLAFMNILRRIMIKTRLNISACLVCTDIQEAIRSLHTYLFADMIACEKEFWKWQQDALDSMIRSHEIVNANVKMASSKEMIDSVQAVVISIFNSTSGKNILPVLVEREKPQRGFSASFGILQTVFDTMVDKGYLIKSSLNGLLIPNKGRLLLQSEKTKFVMIGYLIAYMFAIQAPVNCSLSRLVVDYVMGASMGPLNFVDGREKQELAECKDHLCLMRVGARKITDQFPYSDNHKYVYDYFYNTQHTQTTVPYLDIDNFEFDSDVSKSEKFVFISWMRSLIGENNSTKARVLTKLLTNAESVYKSPSTTITVRKSSDYAGIKVSTCENSITLPQQWLASQAVLETNMNLQLELDLLKTKESLDIVFNSV